MPHQHGSAFLGGLGGPHMQWHSELMLHLKDAELGVMCLHANAVVVAGACMPS